MNLYLEVINHAETGGRIIRFRRRWGLSVRDLHETVGCIIEGNLQMSKGILFVNYKTYDYSCSDPEGKRRLYSHKSGWRCTCWAMNETTHKYIL